MISWLSVVDSAIKIGLGALIGGAFAIWTIRLNQRHDHVKQQIERRCVLLQEAQMEVSRFAGLVSTYWANVRNAAFLRDKGEVLSPESRADLATQEQKVFEAFADLTGARGKILLLGETGAVDALAKLHDACSAFFRIAHIDNSRCTDEALDLAKAEIINQRTLFWEEMAKAYARIPGSK